jgi:hypothetical protein
MDSKTVGKYVFWAGVILAFIFALWPDPADWAPWLLLLLGFAGGYMRVSKESETHFFVMTIALYVFSDLLYELPTIGQVLGDIFSSIGLFLGAAVLAVIVRNVIGWFR